MEIKQHATEQPMGQRRNLKIPWENGNVAYQNLWDRAKAVLRGKFVVIKSYLKK